MVNLNSGEILYYNSNESVILEFKNNNTYININGYRFYVENWKNTVHCSLSLPLARKFNIRKFAHKFKFAHWTFGLSFYG